MVTIKEQIESKAKELYTIRIGGVQEALYRFKEFHEVSHALKLSWFHIAKHCLASELRAEIKGLCFCYPDLNSDSGITIQSGSRKEFALQCKIELEKQLSELEKGT